MNQHSSELALIRLYKGFDQLGMASKDAILFAFEMDMSPEQVVTLTWKKVQQHQLTPFAVELLTRQPRHITSGYVFWRPRNNKPEPLFGLELEVFEAFDMIWSELADLATEVSKCPASTA